jgi:peptidoglycan/LPS O-acetylase OafA/YrhL
MSFAPEFYRKDIDGLRALAIIAVVAYHARIPFTPGGFVGVDVFFVLSGFLITSLLRTEARNTGTVSLRAFYARRIRRLFPALFVVVIVTCLLGSVALVPVLGQQEDLAASGVATALYVSNFYFWLHAPGYFDDSSELQPLLHTWSLSVEEQFYLLWPPIVLAIAGLARRRRWDLERTLLFVTLAILVVSAGWCIRKTFSEPIAAFYLLPSRAWELATGATLALWLPTITARRAGLGGLCSLLGIAAIVAAVSRISVATPFPGYAAALPVFGTALVVLGGHLAERNPVQVVLGWRPLVLVGLLSYSWYLWHWPLLALVRAYSLEAFDPVRDLGVAGASLLVAYASYRLVENPIRYRRPGPFGRNETTIAAGLAMSLAMCVPALALGAWAARTGRHDPALRELAAAKTERSPLRTACHQDPPFERLNPSVNCIAGDAASAPALLLWGDSHADQLSALMQTFARSSPGTPIEVRSFSSCPPLAVYPMRDPSRATGVQRLQRRRTRRDPRARQPRAARRRTLRTLAPRVPRAADAPDAGRRQRRRYPGSGRPSSPAHLPRRCSSSRPWVSGY